MKLSTILQDPTIYKVGLQMRLPKKLLDFKQNFRFLKRDNSKTVIDCSVKCCRLPELESGLEDFCKKCLFESYHPTTKLWIVTMDSYTAKIIF